MKVKMLTTSRGPNESLDQDRIYNLDSARAKELIDGGYAQAVKEGEKETAESPVATKKETASKPAKPRSNKSK